MIEPIVSILENGIMQVTYPDELSVDVHAVRKVLTKKKILAPGRPVAMLFQGDRGNPLDKEMRQFTAGPEVSDATIAAAFIAKSAFGRFLLHLYMDLTNLPYPVRAFRDRDSALVWLLEMQARAGLGTLPPVQRQLERLVKLDNYEDLIAGNQELQRDLDVALHELHRLHLLGPPSRITDTDRSKVRYLSERLNSNWQQLCRNVGAVPELQPRKAELMQDLEHLINTLSTELDAYSQVRDPQQNLSA